MLARILKNFGQTLGIKNLTFNQDHVAHLHIDKIGDLYIEDKPPFMLIYLIREVEHPDIDTYKKALKLCHYKQKNLFPMTPGNFKDNQMVFVTRLEHEQVVLPNIHKCIDQLTKAHDQLAIK